MRSMFPGLKRLSRVHGLDNVCLGSEYTAEEQAWLRFIDCKRRHEGMKHASACDWLRWAKEFLEHWETRPL